MKQLSVDHNLTNEDELLRLSHTGVDIEKLHQSESISFILTPSVKTIFFYFFMEQIHLENAADYWRAA